MITNSMIAFGDQLGAQMYSLASLYYVAKENNQDIVFFEELKNFKRGYQFLDVFDINEISLISINNLLINRLSRFINAIDYKNMTWQSKMKRIYGNNIINFIDMVYYKIFKMKIKSFISYNKLNNNLHTSDVLLKLNENNNYDINNGFGTYQDWKKYENNIIKMFTFKQDIIEEANSDKSLIDIIKNNNSVSVHFRRTDYLIMSSLNLNIDYYKNALKMFDKNDYFIIFSDDIDSIKKMNLFVDYKNVKYVEKKSASVDLYYMTLCKNNIIANSTFSFWGGMLNKNVNKKVICPYRFIGDSAKQHTYINGNYFPDNWIYINN